MSLKSNVLERRLNGLKQIRKMIARATPKDDKKSSLAYFWNKTKQVRSLTHTHTLCDDLPSFNCGRCAQATAAVATGYAVPQEEKEPEEKPIDPNFVLSWLLENEILKLLYTNTHVELIRQSLDILNFLSSKGKLTIEDLDTLWEASLGRHESEKRIIFETIVSLGQNLPSKTIGTLSPLLGRLSLAPCCDTLSRPYGCRSHLLKDNGDAHQRLRRRNSHPRPRLHGHRCKGECTYTPPEADASATIHLMLGSHFR
jgi:hypothetical protein